MKTHGIEVQSIQVLRGHNLYAYMPVLYAIVDIGAYEERPSNSFVGFVDRITAWLPGLQKHECSIGRPGGFIERLLQGTYLAHIIEHITLELQTVMGFDVRFGRARGTGRPGVYSVIIAYKEEEPARAAFDTAIRMTLAAMHDEPFAVAAEIERLMDIADEYRLGPSTGAIVAAARARRIPVLRLTPTGSLVQLGYGVYQKRILASETSLTSAIAVEMCQEKPLTNRMLRAVGVPVPEGRSASSAEEAWTIAQEIGLPIVVKPESGNQGKGVSVNLTTEQEVHAAYAIANAFGGVLVERFIVGKDYRLLVIQGKMVAAARRDPAQVVGDGQHTIRELVEQANLDPRRRPGHSSSLTRIKIDEAARLVLMQQDLNEDSVPALQQVVRLRTNSNLSTGGTAADVTDDVHPQNARLAELAAQILNLDVAGIDMLCEDITRPLAEQDGAIVEVNAAPGLRMHLHPTSGQPRNVGTPVVEMLYPENALSRIPIIAITGTNGKTTVTRLIAHMYETARWVVGMTSTDGTYIGKTRIMEGDCSGPRSAQAILLHPRVEVAVLETARGGILREGLAFDQCQVGVVTNLSADHLGLDGINTLQDLASVKQVVIEAVADDGAGVLNADDPLVAEMAAATEARVIYFSLKPNNPVIRAHSAADGWCVYVRDNSIVLATAEAEIELVELERIPFTLGGKIRFQVQNALAAVAAAWGASLNPALIVRALTTFKADYAMTPGRFNVNELNGIEVILDYGHNEAAVAALMEAAAVLDKRRTVLVIGLPGDRRDEDIQATIRSTIGHIDRYVLHDLSSSLRGRAAGEVPALMRKALPPKADYHLQPDPLAALTFAWSTVKPGDRLIVIADIVDETIGWLRSLAESASADSACDAPLMRDMTEVT